MRNIPNIITVLRIALSLLLLFVEPLSFLFSIIFITCGLSDLLDGYIARKMSATSKMGSIMDSTSDMIFIMVMLIILLPLIKIKQYILLLIVLIAVVRIVSIAIALYKYHTFVAGLHTYANKITGFSLFCFPLLFNVVNTDILALILCFIASVSAVEEMVIHILSKELNTDIMGIFIK